MSNEEVKEEVEKVPEEVSKKVAEEVQAVAEESKLKFTDVKKLKCNYTVHKTERTKLRMNIVEKCAKCGKKFKDGDELYLARTEIKETGKNCLICKKCAK